MRKKLEKDVRKVVVSWAKLNGIVPFRNHMGPGVGGGRPDDEFVGPKGRIAWIEFKAPGKSPDPIQHYNMKNLRALGHAAWWFDDADKAVAFLKDKLL